MKRGVPQKRANVGCTTTPCTNSKKSCRRKLEKKKLRVMIGSLEKSEKEKWGEEKFKNQGSKNWNSAGNPRVIQLEHELHWSERATWLGRVWRHHYAFNTEQNPESHVQPIDLSSSVIVITCHDDHRIWGQLMGLMNSTSLGDLIQTNEAVWTDELARCLWWYKPHY